MPGDGNRVDAVVNSSVFNVWGFPFAPVRLQVAVAAVPMLRDPLSPAEEPTVVNSVTTVASCTFLSSPCTATRDAFAFAAVVPNPPAAPFVPVGKPIVSLVALTGAAARPKSEDPAPVWPTEDLFGPAAAHPAPPQIEQVTRRRCPKYR